MRSAALFQEAQQHIPGGVNSPVRAFKSVEGTPIFFDRGEGAYLFDVDGRRYIDYVNAWGPAILGHAHPAVVAAVQETAKKGLGFGAPTELETQLAEKLRQHLPSLEKVRLVSSGTEAVMSAIRLARGFTGRSKIIKFVGGYHGHADSLLVDAGSGALTLGVPSSPGVPAALAALTLSAPYNDLDSIKAIFEKFGEDIAAVIVEPIAGNMNCVPPVAGFLEGLSALTQHHGSLLIFDEVMTGFRVALGGAQTLYGITPDLTTLGKVIGGGLPLAAFGGRADIMSYLAPEGPVYQAGTLSGNPIAVAAGLATLQEVEKPGFYEALTQRTSLLAQGFSELSQRHSVPLLVQHIGGMFGLFFTEEKQITSYKQVMGCDKARFNHFFHAMLAQGVYLAPSAFEAGFVSIAHTEEIIGATLEKASHSLCNPFRVER